MEITKLKELSDQTSEAEVGDTVRVLITNDATSALLGHRRVERKLRYDDDVGYCVKINKKLFPCIEMERLHDDDKIRVEVSCNVQEGKYIG